MLEVMNMLFFGIFAAMTMLILLANAS